MSTATAPGQLATVPIAPAALSLLDRARLSASPEGWLLLGGSLLALVGALVALGSWPAITSDEYGQYVVGSAAWSAVGASIAAIGGLMCVAAAAAYGVLLGQQGTATPGHPRD